MSGPSSNSPSLGEKIGLLVAILLVVGASVTFDRIFRGDGEAQAAPADDRLLVLEHGGGPPPPTLGVRPARRPPAEPPGRVRRSPEPPPDPIPDPVPVRVHEVKSGESLFEIAEEAYGEGTRWRKIAEANGLREPWVIQPGQQLRIP